MNTARTQSLPPAVNEISARAQSTYRLDIQALRALAVGAVIANHAWGLPTGGFVGVDVFFVISGFLITGLLLRELESAGKIDLVAFFIGRALRLLPLAVFVAALTVAAAHILFFKPASLRVGMDGVASITFVENWHLIRAGVDYLANSQAASPLQHYWSLSVEEQFYVAWPLGLVVLLALARRCHLSKARLRLVIGACLLVLIIISLGFSVIETADRPTSAYFSTASRAWELAVGALLALAPPTTWGQSHLVRHVLRLVGVGGIGVSIFAFSAQTDFPSAAALVPVLATVSVIAAGTGDAPGVVGSGVVFANPVIQWLGSRSYSLYLWHFPVLVFVDFLFPGAVIAKIAALVAVGVLAEVFFRVLERPLHRLGRRVSRGRGSEPLVRGAMSRRRGRLGVLLASLAIVAVTGGSLFQIRGPQWVLTAPVRPATEVYESTDFTPFELARALELAATQEAWTTENRAMLNEVDSAALLPTVAGGGCVNSIVVSVVKECHFGSASAEKQAVVFGDSIAMAWLPGLVEVLLPRGYAIRSMGFASCPAVEVDVRQYLVRARHQKACEEKRHEAVTQITKMHPDLVIISGTADSITRLAGGENGTAADRIWRRGVSASISQIAPHVGDLVFLGSPPGGKSPAECASPLSSPLGCVSSVPDSLDRVTKAQQEAVRLHDRKNVSVIDVVDWFCTRDGECPLAVGGTLVRPDSGHITAAYAQRLSRVLGEALSRSIQGTPR